MMTEKWCVPLAGQDLFLTAEQVNYMCIKKKKNQPTKPNQPTKKQPPKKLRRPPEP